MSIIQRGLSGGAALGVAFAAWGLAAGPIAPADAACTPVAGQVVCAEVGPGWTGVVVADATTGSGTGAAVACHRTAGLTVLYVLNAPTYSTMPLGPTGAEAVLCP